MPHERHDSVLDGYADLVRSDTRIPLEFLEHEHVSLDLFIVSVSVAIGPSLDMRLQHPFRIGVCAMRRACLW
jgi:hypothetical protein